MSTSPAKSQEEDNDLHPGRNSSFRRRGDRLLGLLEKLGILRKRPLVEDRLMCEETERILDDMVTGRVRPLFEYFVCKSYEPWHSVYVRNYMKAQNN